MLGDMNPTISPMAYTNGDPVNNIDLLGLYTESGSGQDNGGDDPGKGGGRVASAPENEKYKGRSKEEVNAAEAAYAALKTFALSGAPAYNEMSPLRQTINDFANSSFVRTVNEWNPYYHGANFVSGTISGKNIYGTPMTGGDVSFAALGMIPGEGKMAEKVGRYVGKSGYKTFDAFKKVYGKAGTNMAWHHIVEKHAANLERFGAEKIHNIKNLNKLPEGAGSVHRKITGFYNSIQPQVTGSRTLTVRYWLKDKSFTEQMKFGLETMKRFINE